MAITKIEVPELFDFGSDNSAFKLPTGTTAERPTSPSNGEMRFNTTTGYVEYYDTTDAQWWEIDYEALCTTNDPNYPITNLAYYKMSNASDSSGNDYNGTATNVNFNVAGKFGNAGEFNGSSSVITSSSLGTALNVSSLSFSLWFKTNLNDSTDRILISSYDGSGNARFYASLLNSGLSVVIYGSSATYIQNFINTVITGTWYHLSVIHTGTTTTVYLNNTAITPSSTSGSAVAIKIAGSPQPITIGQLQGYIGTYALNGSIDQIRIFSSALNASQVTQLYNEIQCVPTIVPSDNFNTVLYTGNGGTQAITGAGFEPDFTWIKQRSGGASHSLQDSVRGAGQSKNIYSDNTAAEGTYGQYGYLSAFGTDGFTVVQGSGSHTNANSSTYVAWNWKAGGSSNTFNKNGTGYGTASAAGLTGESNITIQGSSVNTESGISIIKTLTGPSTGMIIPHGLGTQPELIISKPLNASLGWYTWTPILNNGSTSSNTGWKGLFLDTTAAASSSAYVYASNTHIYDSWAVGRLMVYYSFISIAGYSKIGSFVGNGSTVNVVTGFKPAFIMWKNTTQGSASYDYWFIVDNKTSPSNPVNKVLYPNDSIAETTTSYTIANFNSNGFDIVGSAGGRVFNNSGDTYIYITFAAT